MLRLLQLSALVASSVVAWDVGHWDPDAAVARWQNRRSHQHQWTSSATHPPTLTSSSSSTSSHSSAVEALATTIVEVVTTEVEYATAYVTVTSCEQTVTDCPASSTIVSASTFAIPSKVISMNATPSSSCALPSSPITNEEQVGNSTWGTLCNPIYPKWLDDGNGNPYATAPWGNATTKNTDATIKGDVPVTNVTRYYDLTVSRGRISADGVLRDVILVNNQYPGPLIEANWGDWIEVTVHNNITAPMEGTSLHWHGMLQRGSQWEDGVPSVSQCPIAPGHSLTSRYQAELYGTSWYHAHYSAQYTGGAVGPMQIYGPSSQEYDIDIGPVMLSDWTHIPYFSMVVDAVGTDISKIPVTSDNNLINGRSSFNCSNPSYSNSMEWLGSNLESNISWTCVNDATASKFQFQNGKTHRLRLMNYGADGIQKFSIDGHTMTVIATDYVPVVPYETGVVTLGVGQRTDVLVTANNYSQAMYWMRTELAANAVCGPANNRQSLAAIYYDNADTTGWPVTSSSQDSTSCGNDALNMTRPEYAITPSSNPYQQDLEISLTRNSTGSFEWLMNNQTFRANFNEPLLYKAAAGEVSFPDEPQWNVYNFDKNNSVILNVTNNSPFVHPFHLHGHNFYVLNEGYGAWDGSIVNPQNPMRRDVQIIHGFGYAVFQFEADNPGVWPFHCHVAWHLSGGLAINIISRPGDIGAIPDTQPLTCTDWDYYSTHNTVDQIDAGS